MGPNVPNTAPASTSRIIAGSLVVKDLLEHFGGFRKNDPSLQWEFGNSDVKVKTVVAGTNGAGIASAISVETSEFMEYVVPEVPTCMNFPWREFDVCASKLRLACLVSTLILQRLPRSWQNRRISLSQSFLRPQANHSGLKLTPHNKGHFLSSRLPQVQDAPGLVLLFNLLLVRRYDPLWESVLEPQRQAHHPRTCEKKDLFSFPHKELPRREIPECQEHKEVATVLDTATATTTGARRYHS